MITMNELDRKKADTSSVIPAGTEIPDNEDIEVDDSFFDDEIDVVRAEYASVSNEPTISFNNCQLYVNMVCIKKFPETDYVQFLINKTKKQLALLPVEKRVLQLQAGGREDLGRTLSLDFRMMKNHVLPRFLLSLKIDQTSRIGSVFRIFHLYASLAFEQVVYAPQGLTGNFLFFIIFSVESRHFLRI